MLEESRKSLRNKFSTKLWEVKEDRIKDLVAGESRRRKREVREVKDREEGTSAVLLHSQRLTN